MISNLVDLFFSVCILIFSLFKDIGNKSGTKKNTNQISLKTF